MAQEKKSVAHKQGFLQGAAILTIGTLASRVVGALFKIPLTRLITTQGAGHFNVAYNIYTVLLNVSSTGLPIAVSRMVSEAATLGRRRQVQKIRRISLWLFVLIGLLCGGAMLIFAPQLATWMRDPDAWYAIAVLAPAVLFVCISSSFRGYFQGQQYMTPTAVTQVLEAFCKLFLGLGAILLALRAGWNYAQATGAAIVGVTIGAALGSGYLALQYRRKRLRLTPEDAASPVLSTWETTRRLLTLAIPITIGATGLQVFNALGSKVILGRLQDALGYPLSEASSLYGVFSMAQTLYLLPSALVQPLAISIIPAVTSALALSKLEDARRLEESSFRIAGLIALPCGLGMSVLSVPIQRALYGYDPQTLETAGPVLALLGIAAVLYCFILVTNAILQAHGKATTLIYTTLAGGIANLAVSYLLVGSSRFHIHGAAIGTVVYCVVTLALNLLAIGRYLSKAPRLLPQVMKSLLAACVMGAAAFLTDYLLHSLVLAIGAAVLTYLACVYCLKILTWYDCQLLPKGDTIARLLRVRSQDSPNSL